MMRFLKNLFCNKEAERDRRLGTSQVEAVPCSACGHVAGQGARASSTPAAAPAAPLPPTFTYSGRPHPWTVNADEDPQTWLVTGFWTKHWDAWARGDLYGMLKVLEEAEEAVWACIDSAEVVGDPKEEE